MKSQIYEPTEAELIEMKKILKFTYEATLNFLREKPHESITTSIVICNRNFDYDPSKPVSKKNNPIQVANIGKEIRQYLPYPDIMNTIMIKYFESIEAAGDIPVGTVYIDEASLLIFHKSEIPEGAIDADGNLNMRAMKGKHSRETKEALDALIMMLQTRSQIYTLTAPFKRPPNNAPVEWMTLPDGETHDFEKAFSKPIPITDFHGNVSWYPKDF